MTKRKELTVETIIVSFEGDKRVERKWEDIPKEEQEKIKEKFTDCFMKAAGYRRATEEELKELEDSEET